MYLECSTVEKMKYFFYWFLYLNRNGLLKQLFQENYFALLSYFLQEHLKLVLPVFIFVFLVLYLYFEVFLNNIKILMI